MSKTYIFDPINTASGSVKFQFTVDNGLSGTENVSGHYFLNLAESTEAVEDMGFGGFPKIGSIDIEIYDRDNLFHDTIFKKSEGLWSISTCDCLITLNTSYCIMYGKIDLSTVTFQTIHYRGSYYRTCKFTVLDKIADLQNKTITEYYLYLAGRATDKEDVHGNTLNVVKMPHVFFDLVKQVVPTLATWDVSGIRQKYSYSVSHQRDYNFDELYMMYSTLSLYENGENIVQPTFFDPALSVNWRTLTNCYELLKLLCNDFVCYPVLQYLSTRGEHCLYLKQRQKGTPKTEPSGLLSDLESTFYGYEMLKTMPAMVLSTDYQKGHIYPIDTNEETYQAFTRSKAEFTNYFKLFNPTIGRLSTHWYGLPPRDGEIYYTASDGLRVISERSFNLHVADDKTGSLYEVIYIWDDRMFANDDAFSQVTDYNLWMYYVVGKYWVNNRYGVNTSTSPLLQFPVMKERRYTGIASDIMLLDSFQIDGVGYSITEIKRNFVENEVSMKMVQY